MEIEVTNLLSLWEDDDDEKYLLKVKSYLCEAKKDGKIFFKNEVSLLSKKEKLDLYYWGLSATDGYKEAFPVNRENFVLPKDEKERFYIFKKYYEIYYPGSDMDFDLYKTFNPVPYKGGKYLWFYRS